jgi:Na+-transporting methylmalonyl-CoA/oxaloacetate decarboxylase gamma subunit
VKAQICKISRFGSLEIWRKIVILGLGLSLLHLHLLVYQFYVESRVKIKTSPKTRREKYKTTLKETKLTPALVQVLDKTGFF